MPIKKIFWKIRLQNRFGDLYANPYRKTFIELLWTRKAAENHKYLLSYKKQRKNLRTTLRRNNNKLCIDIEEHQTANNSHELHKNVNECQQNTIKIDHLNKSCVLTLVCNKRTRLIELVANDSPH